MCFLEASGSYKSGGRKLFFRTFQRCRDFPPRGGRGARTVPKYYDMQRWRLDINPISYQRNISSFWMDDADGRLTLMFLSGSHLFGSNNPPAPPTALVSTNECVSCLRLQQRTPNSAGTRLMCISTNKLQRIVLLVRFFFFFSFLTLEHKRTRMERRNWFFNKRTEDMQRFLSLPGRNAAGKVLRESIWDQNRQTEANWQIHSDSNPTWCTVEISPVDFFFFFWLDVGLGNLYFEDFVLLRDTNGICLWIWLDFKNLDLCPFFLRCSDLSGSILNLCWGSQIRKLL